MLSARDLLEAAAQEGVLLVALVAPAPAAAAGFARAARDADAPLVLARPSGAADEKGPEEAREDAAFVDAAWTAAADLRFPNPVVLLKEPPRAGSSVPDTQRVQREIDAGFTGLALVAEDSSKAVRNAALAASAVCSLDLGLEIVPLGGAEAAAELARQLRSRGANPSAVRLTGLEDRAAAVAEELPGVAMASATEALVAQLLSQRIQQLVAAGPFLRALRRAAPAEVWDELQRWADDNGATLDESAAHHQRMLRELSSTVQQRLEALCCFEALELYRKSGARRTGPRLAHAVGALHAPEG